MRHRRQQGVGAVNGAATPTIRSDYAILNLSHSTNTCEHRVRSREGYWARESSVLRHPPLSLTYVADVLKVVGVELGDRYTISTNCGDSFYVAALVSDDRNDRLTVLEPPQWGWTYSDIRLRARKN